MGILRCNKSYSKGAFYMDEKLKRFILFVRSKWILNLIIFAIVITFFLQGVLTSVLTEWLVENFGIYGTIFTSLTVCFMLLGFVSIWFQRTEMKRTNLNKKIQLEANPTFEDLLEKHKGLIVSVSRLNEPKESVLDKINAIDDIFDKDGLKTVYDVRGIGQTFRALVHHAGELGDCWLLCTGDVDESQELVNHFINRLLKNVVRIHPVRIDDPYKIETTFEEINRIYSEELKTYMLAENEVIADLTGGTAIMSCAMILVCLSPDRDMEYVLQNDERKLIKIKENVSQIAFKR
jgi:hypothetical protein